MWFGTRLFRTQETINYDKIGKYFQLDYFWTVQKNNNREF